MLKSRKSSISYEVFLTHTHMHTLTFTLTSGTWSTIELRAFKHCSSVSVIVQHFIGQLLTNREKIQGEDNPSCVSDIILGHFLHSSVELPWPLPHYCYGVTSQRASGVDSSPSSLPFLGITAQNKLSAHDLQSQASPAVIQCQSKACSEDKH